MGIYDDLSNLEARSSTPSQSKKAREKKTPVGKPRNPQESVERPTSQPIEQPTDQSTDLSTEIDALGPVVGRPCSFYITQNVDRWLDEAVRYLREKGLHKMDRSVLLNALIHDRIRFKPASLDKLRPKLLAHLTNKSLKRAQSTD